MKGLIIAASLVLGASSVQARDLPTVRDIGVIGLYSHDLFAWDSEKEENTENSRLDLSTIFDWEDGKRINKGGNPKNSENAPVYTITMNLVDFYKDTYKSVKGSQEEKHGEARKETVKLFHKWVQESFSRLTSLPFPETGLNLSVSNSEQAAMRAMHDVLPGRIDFIRKWWPLKTMKVTDWKMARVRLNDAELDQTIADFDGEYSPEYLEIKIPFTSKTVNLREKDKEFVSKFSDYDFEYMLSQLKLVGEDEMMFEELAFSSELLNMAQKSICSEGNQWMPEVECY